MTPAYLASLATLANKAARLARRGGAPPLSETSDAETVAAWLQWNDPNGCHTSALALAEGCDPYDRETAWDALAEVLSEF